MAPPGTVAVGLDGVGVVSWGVAVTGVLVGVEGVSNAEVGVMGVLVGVLGVGVGFCGVAVTASVRVAVGVLVKIGKVDVLVGV